MSLRATEIKRQFDHAHAALAEEHKQIMALLNLLESDPDPGKLVHRLEQLHNTLVDHFAREQFPGGLYESMGAFGSRWHGDLRELISEHCTILSQARGLLDEARRLPPNERGGLQPDVIALVHQLTSHEEKEHRLANLLQRSAETDAMDAERIGPMP